MAKKWRTTLSTSAASLEAGWLPSALAWLIRTFAFVDLEEIGVDGSCRDAIVDHSVEVLKVLKSRVLSLSEMGTLPMMA